MQQRKIAEIIILIIIGTIFIVVTEIFKTRVSKQGKIVKSVLQKSIYGINIDSLIVYRENVKTNENLSSILNNYKVDNNTIDLINRKSKGIIDLRKIKAGNNYTVLCSNDSSETVSFFIYEESPVNFIVFSLKDSVHVYAGKKAVKYIKKSIKGEIKSSLWNAMKESNT
ncbi:MAG: hypothetical protein KA792_07080, partial [Bacteroidales bacterium]|nr:hypothetical protein [Bacteroidales bacterium]